MSVFVLQPDSGCLGQLRQALGPAVVGDVGPLHPQRQRIGRHPRVVGVAFLIGPPGEGIDGGEDRLGKPLSPQVSQGRPRVLDDVVQPGRSLGQWVPGNRGRDPGGVRGIRGSGLVHLPGVGRAGERLGPRGEVIVGDHPMSFGVADRFPPPALGCSSHHWVVSMMVSSSGRVR